MQQGPEKTERTVLSDPFEAERAELVLRIWKSSVLSRSPDQRKLLIFLWDNRGFEIDQEMLEYHFYNLALKKGHLPFSDRSKTAISELRKKLGVYNAASKQDKWHCILPGKSDTEDETYQLAFPPALNAIEPAPRRFWGPHLVKADDTLVVTGTHLFFFSEKKGMVIRLPFFVPPQNGTKALVLKEAKRARKDVVLDGFVPWPNTYLAIGDVEAYETLTAFFTLTIQKPITRKTTASISIRDVRTKAPILFGRPQTNPYIKQLYADASKRPGKVRELGYQIHDVQGTVKISDMTDSERADLKEFPVTVDGIVGPISRSRKAFCVVSRFRYPGTNAPITVVACDYYSPVIARVMRIFTEEHDCQGVFDRLGWGTEDSVPDTFELLFTVDLLDGEVPDESSPELITWRIP